MGIFNKLLKMNKKKIQEKKIQEETSGVCYNKRIYDILNNSKNDDLRYNKDINSEYYIHDNQIEVAKKIILNWTLSENSDIKDRHAILLAKMQSGKTGVFMSLIYIINKLPEIKHYFKIEKFSILTGMNSTGLEMQLIDRIENQTGLSNDIADTIVLKNSEMQSYIASKEPLDISNRLIIVDESHYGNVKQNNVLPEFLKLHKINQQNNDALNEKNVYFLSVSATPFDEINSDIVESKLLVELKNSGNYYGITEFDELNLIHQNKKLNKSNLDWLNDQLDGQLRRMEKLDRIGAIIIRSNNKDVYEYLNNNTKFNIIQFHGKDIDYEKFNKQHLASFEHKKGSYYYPKKPIIFLIKGTFRAGVSIDSIVKKHIFAVYDTVHSQTHTTAQGLVGRLCGYYPNNSKPITQFYVNKQATEEYMNWEKNDFSDEYLPTNNKVVYNLTLDKENKREYTISGKHYKSFLLDIENYSDYMNNKNDIYSYIYKNCKNTDLLSILEKVNQKDIHEQYIYKNNINYKKSVINKYIIPIKESLHENINLLPRPKKIIDESIVGNFYLHIVEDTNITELMNDDDYPLNTNNRVSNNKLIIYIGQYCYKYAEVGKGAKKTIKHLETN